MSFNPFGSVPVPRKKSTNFDESHSVSGTFPLSKVIPVFFTDTLPGSTWKINTFNLSRLEPGRVSVKNTGITFESGKVPLTE